MQLIVRLTQADTGKKKREHSEKRPVAIAIRRTTGWRAINKEATTRRTTAPSYRQRNCAP